MENGNCFYFSADLSRVTQYEMDPFCYIRLPQCSFEVVMAVLSMTNKFSWENSPDFYRETRPGEELASERPGGWWQEEVSGGC